jgi:hypothetical protein
MSGFAPNCMCIHDMFFTNTATPITYWQMMQKTDNQTTSIEISAGCNRKQ